MENGLMASLKLFASRLFSMLAPLVLLVAIGYGLLYASIVSTDYGRYGAFLLGIATIVGSLYPLNRYAYIAYGMALGGFCLLYASCYQAYSMNQLTPVHFFAVVSILNIWSMLIAMRFHGWLLAVLSITIAGALPTLVLEQYITKPFLLCYFIVVLAMVLLAAYIMKWFELVPLCFIWYLLYNPLLFQMTTIDGKPGLLTLYEVLYAMGTLFVIFTGIPWLHSLVTNNQRVFDSLCITLIGAYTFAMSRFVIHAHLAKVQELPFFVKMLVKDVPTMTNVQVQMFFIYAIIYGVLFTVLLLLNKKSIVVLATLANLCCLSLFGLVYVHSNTFAFVAQIVQLHKLIINIIT